ncbi:MAG TPA: 30S ribosomal protein S6--L-glutamate ligase [Halieaceae bacterium]|jgi:ribosomal protein S6--L-glutamate ligase|uniref:30S ribosomal protein S6--L-glutamate ligase n=1 Tax=Haliea TaxID=475794 RepID=UPI000C495ED4|nr:30S ribosomal protein S6--L-glutamate ligase [Haliea sp.]HBM84969.1 30S ribosomal protein S6--L-glutamate ligase [Halieaceae bacterium]MAD65794.1 30S ribosomal protein S6--L-glutamate ligase [Haliea sp.]MAY92737.1 30S ribosomal protein S6--L-glutamate ligase [Haliea sp.]MBK40274.1 30S ribosomal protein S6--L-glutamate ligase [Haliea sp.]MBP69957.1 30S ribosomal protein S6--L-glutamate ligase [Haliea sp.]|tara:strand:- start:80912 stop:81829 length:918 start_codon:yes stop_codon:yes gene_type:complete
MKIGILSRNRRLYSTRRLVEAAAARGHDVSVIDVLKCYMNITANDPTVIYQHSAERVEALDFEAVIPRIGASITSYGCAVLRQFEVGHVYSLNESIAITRSRDKLRAHQLLARRGIGQPVTSYAHSARATDKLIESVGGAPLILKLTESTHGNGVLLAETKKAAEALINAFRGIGSDFLVQEFIREAGGSDIRCFVVGDKVIAAMQRKAVKGEYRSNLHRGGTAEVIKLRPEERRLAVKAARVMGLDLAGVDILRSNHGPLVIEVNSSPGLEGIEKATGIDIASKIIEYLEKDALAGPNKPTGKG